MHEERATVVVSLDGESDWLIAADPSNRGREERWWGRPVAAAVPVRVPWMMQGALPGYHGVAWYWLSLAIPRNPHPGGRYLVRFWMVDYACQVWVNGTSVGTHEDGEEMFVLDATDAVRPGEPNAICLRVLNPTHERIDGIVLAETPHRNKVSPERAGSSFNSGGIVDSVELLLVPALRVEDLFVRARAR
jgi:beta-galactosidase/beta-glucuronidase